MYATLPREVEREHLPAIAEMAAKIMATGYASQIGKAAFREKQKLQKRKMAKGRFLDHGEFTGAAWQKIMVDFEKGVRDREYLIQSGKYGIIDYVRGTLYGHGWGLYKRGGKPRVGANVPTDFQKLMTDSEECESRIRFDAPEPRKPVEERLLELWCETRRQRLSIKLRDRVVMYLYYVEGMNVHELKELFGISESMISLIRSNFVKTISGKKMRAGLFRKVEKE